MITNQNLISNPLEFYSSEIATTMVFSLGYYLFKYLKNNTGWKDPKIQEKKLKQRMISALERWEYADTIEEYTLLINSTNPEVDVDPHQVLLKMTNKSLIPTIDTYNALLLNSYLNNNIEAASKLQEEIIDSYGPVTPNNYTLNIIIS